MGLDQYLCTDQYFSSTWEKTGEQAEAIRQICQIPSPLIHKVNATVRITLMEWHKCYWLDSFIRTNAQATASGPDSPEVLVDDLVLKRFIKAADNVLQVELNPQTGQPYNMHELFPHPDWWFDSTPKRPAVYDSDDLKILSITKERFEQILKEITNVDLVYRVSV